MLTGWLLSKFDDKKLPDASTTPVPIVASLSLAWRAATGPLKPDGFALVHVHCWPVHVEYFKADPDVVWCGNEWSVVPKAVLDTYAAQLDPTVTYANMGQVIDKLLEWDPRFHLRADGWAH